MSHKQKHKHSIHMLLKYNNPGSFAHQADRKHMLMHMAEDLRTLNINISHCKYLKVKHVEALVKYWLDKGIAASTIKNRMSAIRFLFAALKKPELPSNKELGIPNRSYKSSINRAKVNVDLSGISNPHVKMSLELQRQFGLRREESIKIIPAIADTGNVLQLQPTWCKNGRGRFVPIQTKEQRYWLEEAKTLANGGSLIPPHKTYIQQRHVYDKQVQRANLNNMHGLRHAYAQQKYKELTGWEAPINGGPTKEQLTSEQKTMDKVARLTLSELLGHSRLAILANYCA